MNNPNERKVNETQEQFRNRRKSEILIDKSKKRGRLLWDSSKKGTYIRKLHGAL